MKKSANLSVLEAISAPKSRQIDLIVVHCTATKPSSDVHSSDVDRFHRQRGFAGIGYHFLIALDGSIELGRPLEQVGAHCLGHNARSIGVAYVGGLDTAGKPADTRTAPQKQALTALLQRLRQLFPQAEIAPHRRFAAKACPCFDVDKEYAKL